jgi:hypothetical protein
MATFNLRRNVKNFNDVNYNFNVLNWLLLGNMDEANILTVPAAIVEGTLQAGQIIVGADSTFEDGYNPYTKASLEDVEAAKAYAEMRAAEVQSIAENIANGAYSGTFIDGRHLYSPIISGTDAYFEGTIRIGDGKFNVDTLGNLSAAQGKFRVPWNADGVYNDYGGAARWKFSEGAYLFQNSSEFRVYLGGAQKFTVLSDGSAYVVESGIYEQLATRRWAQDNTVARFG